MSLWNKIKYLNLNIFRTRFCKPLIFQTQIIWSNRIHSLKYVRSATFGSKDIVIKKSEFVAKTQFLCEKNWCFSLENTTFWIVFNISHIILYNMDNMGWLSFKKSPKTVRLTKFCNRKMPAWPKLSVLIVQWTKTRQLLFSNKKTCKIA